MKKYYLIDCDEQRLGKVAVKAADLLRGKNKTDFELYKDSGDHVVIINSNLLDIRPQKAIAKTYFRHSGYPGGLKSETMAFAMKADSREVVRRAVYGMLPANRLRNLWLKRLKIYKDEKHEIKNQDLQKV